MARLTNQSGRLSLRALRTVASAAEARSRMRSPSGLTRGDLRPITGLFGQQLQSDTPIPFLAQITEVGQPPQIVLAETWDGTSGRMVVAGPLPEGLTVPFDLWRSGAGEILTVTRVARPGDAGTSEEEDTPATFDPPAESTASTSTTDTTSAGNLVLFLRRWIAPHLSDSATEALLSPTGPAYLAEPTVYSTVAVGTVFEVPGTVPYGFQELKQDVRGSNTTHGEGRAGRIIWEEDESGERVEPLTQERVENPVYEVNGLPLAPGDVVRAWLADSRDYYLCERALPAPLWLSMPPAANADFLEPLLLRTNGITGSPPTSYSTGLSRPRELASGRAVLDAVAGRTMYPHQAGLPDLAADVGPDDVLIVLEEDGIEDAPAAVPFLIRINNEHLRVTRKITATVWAVERNVNGSTHLIYDYVSDGEGSYTREEIDTHDAGDSVELLGGPITSAAATYRPYDASAFTGQLAAPSADLAPPGYTFSAVVEVNGELGDSEQYDLARIAPTWPTLGGRGPTAFFQRPAGLYFWGGPDYQVFRAFIDVPSGLLVEGIAPGTVLMTARMGDEDHHGMVSLEAQAFSGIKVMGDGSFDTGMIFGDGNGGAGNTIAVPGFNGGVRIAEYDPETDTVGDDASFAAGDVSITGDASIDGTATGTNLIGNADGGTWA